jgi:hypothetical protein
MMVGQSFVEDGGVKAVGHIHGWQIGRQSDG